MNTDLNALDKQAFDFRADLLTIQQSPPSGLPRIMLWITALLIAGLIAWLFLGKLDIVATAQGRLVPMSFTKVVQPAESGIVKDILVRDGQEVAKGDVLLRLDSQLSSNQLNTQSKDVAIKKATLRYIDAEIQDKSANQSSDNRQFIEIGSQVRAQFDARRRAYLDELSHETSNLEKAQADLRAAKQVLLRMEEVLPSYQKTANAYAEMRAQDLVAEIEAEEKKREFVEKQQEIKAQIASLGSYEALISSSKKKLRSIKSNYKAQLERERVTVLTELNKSEQQLTQTTIQSRYLEVKAPVDGVVKDLAITTQGAVVQSGALLLNLVPKQDPVQAEVILSNEDVGFVWIGQKAQIKVAAYPFQKYGLLKGTVTMVSADSAEPNEQQSAQRPPLTYKALLQLDEQKLFAYNGESLPVSPGMAVTAELHQGRRSVLEYILSPVLKVGLEAGRER